ncbi:MAG: hypothetical protein V7641_1842 [Blastocatellia bacterium]
MGNEIQKNIGSYKYNLIKCIIWCCDKKPYQVKNKSYNKYCQRLGSRKHSCVLHKLRKHTKSGKLTQNSKYKGIQASPKIKVKGIKRMLIPDIKIGSTIIDAKFPCPKKWTPSNQFITRKSDMSWSGKRMLTKKEKTDYKKIPGVKKVFGLAPGDVKGICKCT